MNRFIIDELMVWKNKSGRKPLILRGARQVGKTWLMREFAEKNYKNCAYINFDNDKGNILKNLFNLDFDTQRIISALEIVSDTKIEKQDTLIIFDEIQESPRALAALKYFNENANDYHIVCAGSLLGVKIHGNSSFPVGKVEFFDLYPLSFLEFMDATGNGRLLNILKSGDFALLGAFHEKLHELLKLYYFIGGMPEAVANYIENKDLAAVRKIQTDILAGYEFDFSKHAPSDILPRLKMIWDSIPKQLLKEKKKFVYGQVKEGARAREFEQALMWLLNSGLVYKVLKISKPDLPLSAYAEESAFKIFLLDVGLLGALNRLDPKSIINGNMIYTEFKGSLTEQYVQQQLVCSGLDPYYWTAANSTAEIDFILSDNGFVIPLEVKAEENLQAKSLKSYIEHYSPQYAFRISMAKYRKEANFTNIPLYAVDILQNISKLN